MFGVFEAQLYFGASNESRILRTSRTSRSGWAARPPAPREVKGRLTTVEKGKPSIRLTSNMLSFL